MQKMRETYTEEKEKHKHEHYTRKETTEEGDEKEKHLYPILCVEGIKEEGAAIYTNTCGGDSGKLLKTFYLCSPTCFIGGGLYCFNPDDKKYFVLGVLHGGPGSDCTKEKLMYFNNIMHEDYQRLFDDNPDIRDAVRQNADGN